MDLIRFAPGLIGAAALLWSGPALATGAQPACTELESRRADAGTEALKDWSAVHDWYRRWARCDDGGVAEGVSEAVSLLLAKHWNQTAQLASLGRRHPAFADFVVRHIDETVPDDRWKLVATRARAACPVGARVLCNRIERATRSLVPQ
jgi:hypothetical protein